MGSSLAMDQDKEVVQGIGVFLDAQAAQGTEVDQIVQEAQGEVVTTVALEKAAAITGEDL